MSTLAHSFMADFDEEDEDEQQQTTTTTNAAASSSSAAAAAAASGHRSVKQESKEEDEDEDGDEYDEIRKKGDAGAAGGDAMDEDEDDDEEAAAAEAEAAAAAAAEDDAGGDNSMDMALLAASLPSYSNATPLSSLSALLKSDKLQMHLAVISHFQFGTPLPLEGSLTPAEAASAPHAIPYPPVNKDREYPYIVSSNLLAVEIDNHIAALHKYARDLYAPRYSELEQLLSNPVEYARVASVIGNETDMNRITKLVGGLGGIPNNVLLTISVTATTTRGKPLPETELEKLAAVCNNILELDKAKAKMHAYISSRMSVLAPNVSAMLGTDVAAKLVALAGGIKKLGEMPACNIQNLGKRGKNSSGLSRVSQGIHDGLIVTSKVIQDTPLALRQRALRLLAGKVALAARLDSFGAEDGDDESSSADGSRGRGFLEEIQAKIDKWQEPPAAKSLKALPIPLQRGKTKRGGKRYRKEKERMAVTEMTKQKNRMFFGKEEVVDEYTGEGMGMLGQKEGTGVLRIAQKDAKLAKRLSQKMQARLKRTGTLGVGAAAGAAAAAGGGAAGAAKAALAGLGTVTSLASISGTASSIAFTPMQGMNLVKTESAATRAVQKANDNYFSSSGSFARVKKDVADTSAAAAAAGGAAKTVRKALPPVPSFSQATASAAAVGNDIPLPDSKRQRVA